MRRHVGGQSPLKDLAEQFHPAAAYPTTLWRRKSQAPEPRHPLRSSAVNRLHSEVICRSNLKIQSADDDRTLRCGDEWTYIGASRRDADGVPVLANTRFGIIRNPGSGDLSAI